MAAPTYISKGLAVDSVDAINVAWPFHQVNDIGVLVVEITGNNTLSTPSGWTLIGEANDVASTAGGKLGVYWKRAASGSEPDVTVADTGNHQIGQIYTFGGCLQTATPVNVSTTGSKATASTTATVPAITTTIADTLIVMCVGRPDDSSSVTHFSSPTNANLSSLTERGEAGTNLGNGGGFGVFTGVLATAGSTGTTTITKSVSTTDTYVTFALQQQPVYVNLNSPADGASTSDTTPTIEFTGYDPNGIDDLEYNIQIDTVNTFDSQVGTPVVIDSYSETNRDTHSDLYTGSFVYRAQTFTNSTGSDKVITQAKFHLAKNGSPTGTLYARVYASTGTPGTNATPTGSSLAQSGGYSAASLTGTFTLIDFDFTGSDRITLVSGTTYCIVLYFSSTSSDSSNSVRIGGDSSSSSHSGNPASSTDGSSWSASSSFDYIFYVYGSTLGPLISKTSESDTGFLNTVDGADTHPFDQAEKISYTVQAGDALAEDTYYWRAQAKDPSGDNVYTAWATTRSFSVTSGSNIGTLNGLAYASVGTINNLAPASIGTINSLA